MTFECYSILAPLTLIALEDPSHPQNANFQAKLLRNPRIRPKTSPSPPPKALHTLSDIVKQVLRSRR
jgi:hypothetical protein